jgi:hypothetical protein
MDIPGRERNRQNNNAGQEWSHQWKIGATELRRLGETMKSLKETMMSSVKARKKIELMTRLAGSLLVCMLGFGLPLAVPASNRQARSPDNTKINRSVA